MMLGVQQLPLPKMKCASLRLIFAFHTSFIWMQASGCARVYLGTRSSSVNNTADNLTRAQMLWNVSVTPHMDSNSKVTLVRIFGSLSLQICARLRVRSNAHLPTQGENFPTSLTHNSVPAVLDWQCSTAVTEQASELIRASQPGWMAEDEWLRCWRR